MEHFIFPLRPGEVGLHRPDPINNLAPFTLEREMANLGLRSAT